MPGPEVIPVEGAGEAIGNALSSIADAIQRHRENQQAQQEAAMRALLQAAQLRNIESETTQRGQQTADDRKRQQLADKQQQREDEIRTGVQRYMGPLMIAVAKGARPGDKAYDDAINQAFTHNDDPDITAAFRTAVENTNKMFASGAQAQTARTEAAVGGAEAPARIAAAGAQTAASRALDQWYQQHPNSGPLEVYLTHLRASLERRSAQTAGDAQADMAQRQMIIGAFDAARRAKAADDARHFVNNRRPLSAYLDEQAQTFTDPITHKNMTGAELAAQAGVLIRGIPKIASPTGKIPDDAVSVRRILPALRRAGFDDVGIASLLKDNGYSREALQRAGLK